jgi:hypothetical protein
MKTIAEYRKPAEKYRKLIEQNRAELRRLRQALLQTQLVIERAALAYVVSRWTLDRIEQTRSKSDLTPPILLRLARDGGRWEAAFSHGSLK